VFSAEPPGRSFTGSPSLSLGTALFRKAVDHGRNFALQLGLPSQWVFTVPPARFELALVNFAELGRGPYTKATSFSHGKADTLVHETAFS
jgi:hypothetical protein